MYTIVLYEAARQDPVVSGDIIAYLNTKGSKSEVVIPPETQFFIQPLDHFDTNNNQTWQQKYYFKTIPDVNENAPNILGLSDRPVAAHQVEEGFFAEQAKRLKTNVFVIDIRVFGSSPLAEDLTDEVIKYFTVEQMLADIENFMQKMNQYLKSKNPHNNRSKKWIIGGCGAIGILTVHAKIKYPDLIIGAIPVSAPLIPSVEFSDYFLNIFNSIREMSPECVENIQEGFKEMDSISKSSNALQELSDAFQLCSIDENRSYLKKNDISILYYIIATIITAPDIARVVGEKFSMDDICVSMNNKDNGSPFRRLAQVYESLRASKNQECTPLYDDHIRNVKNTSYIAQLKTLFPKLRERKFNQCFQLGFLISSKESQDIFSGNKFSLEFQEGVCKDSFPTWKLENLQKYIHDTKVLLSENLPNLTNVVFVHEKSDPFWSTFYQTTNPESFNIEVPGSGACTILGKAVPDDPRDLVQAREKILDLITVWSISSLQ